MAADRAPGTGVGSWRTRMCRALETSPVRVATQAAAGTLLVFIICWPPVAWRALSLNYIGTTPMLILVLFHSVLLISEGRGLSALQTGLYVAAGAFAGCGCGVGVTYITMEANGGQYVPAGVAKAATFVCLTGLFMFVTTVARFRLLGAQLALVYVQVVFGIATAGAYYIDGDVHLPSLFWAFYAALGGAVACVTTVLVLPRPAGRTVRHSVGQALASTGRALEGCVGVMTGEVCEATGRLAAASGETHELIGVDSGLYPLLKEQVLEEGAAAGGVLQNDLKFLPATRWEWDVYRAQHVFPTATYRLLATLAQATLSCAMMTASPVQTGTLSAVLLHRHRAALRGVAAAFRASCEGLAGVLMWNEPMEGAVKELAALEAGLAALCSDVTGQTCGHDAPQNVAVLSMMLSLIISACKRLRRIFILLPDALLRAQPGSRAAVAAYLSAAPSKPWAVAEAAAAQLQQQCGEAQQVESMLEEGCLPGQQAQAGRGHAAGQEAQDLHFMQAGQQAGREAQPPAGQQPPSEVAQQVRAAASCLLGNVLKAPSVKRPPAAPRPQPRGRLRSALDALQDRTGVTQAHLALGIQLLLAWETIAILLVFPQVHQALGSRTLWAAIVIVVCVEPTEGAAVFKAALRLLGTVSGAAAGLAAIGVTLLVNGLSYTNSPQKFIVMALALAVVSACGAYVAVRWPVYAYFGTVSNIMAMVVALPAFITDQPVPMIAVWRIVNTAVGMAAVMLSCSLAFPVTAKQVFQDAMASTLRGLACCADVALGGVLDSMHSTVDVAGSPPGPKLSDLDSDLGTEDATALAAPAFGKGNGQPSTALQDGQGGPQGAGAAEGRDAAHAGLVDGHPGCVVGTAYLALMSAASKVGSGMATMQRLAQALRVESATPFKLLRPRVALPLGDAMRAAALCRHLLCVLSSFSLLLDDAEHAGQPLLQPHTQQLESLVAQLHACMHAFAGLVQGRVRAESAAEMVLQVEQQVQRLFFSVLLSQPAGMCGEMHGLALLAMLASAACVARLLCIALTTAYCSGGAGAQAQAQVQRLLEEPARWALDERVMEVACGVMAGCLTTGAKSSLGGSARGPAA